VSSKHNGALTALTLPVGACLLVGHVDETGRHDPTVPIPAGEYRWPAFYADARCRRCPARSELSCGDGEAVLLIVHRDQCAGLAAIRRWWRYE
jgi:hypothetical protein